MGVSYLLTHDLALPPWTFSWSQYGECISEEQSLIPRPDLLDPLSPPGVEVFQLTVDKEVPSSHVYMEAQIFTPDSKRFLLHRSAHAHGSDKSDPRHQYLLCDLEDGGMLSPVTDELGPTAPSVSPDGEFIYYFIDETEPGGGRLTLKRRRIDGTRPEVLLVIDAPLPGSGFQPSHIYSLSTISSDGKKLALSCFLGDGNSVASPWGLLVFDIAAATVNLILAGVSWCNVHPQFSRSLDPRQRRDILVQENHGNVCLADGSYTRLVGGVGADIHVIRDDGMEFRDLPWGRDGSEFAQGHQCWRGRSDWAITSTVTRDVGECRLIESRAVATEDHCGLKTAGGIRNHLSREFKTPLFYHFATDIAGRRVISDCGPAGAKDSLYCCELGEPGVEAFTTMTRLLSPHCSWDKGSHIHPFLSPDGMTAFFNSDESGILQAYMVRGLELLFRDGAGR